MSAVAECVNVKVWVMFVLSVCVWVCVQLDCVAVLFFVSFCQFLEISKAIHFPSTHLALFIHGRWYDQKWSIHYIIPRYIIHIIYKICNILIYHINTYFMSFVNSCNHEKLSPVRGIKCWNYTFFANHTLNTFVAFVCIISTFLQ